MNNPIDDWPPEFDTLVATPGQYTVLMENEEVRVLETKTLQGVQTLIHEKGIRITLSGKAGDDAKRYQEREVELVIRRVEDEKAK